MKLSIDFETRSEAIIQDTGALAYAQHPSTEVFCMAIKIDNGDTRLWVNPKFRIPEVVKHFPCLPTGQIFRLLRKAKTIEAHNAFFEQCIIRYVLDGWPTIPLKKWRCSAAKAATVSIPRSLDGACEALGLSETKDKDGYFTMLKMCKPRKPTKHNKAKWHETPEDFIKLFRYCIKDVDAEYALSRSLPALSPKELEIWRLDQAINFRGIPVDVPTIKNALILIEEHEARVLEEFQNITGLNSPRQVQKTLEWLRGKGLKIPNLSKPMINKALALKKPLPDEVVTVLKARRSLAKSSTGKLSAMINGLNIHNRVCDTMMYHGASTGRWAGMRLQPHNMVRKMPEAWEEILEAVNGGIDLDTFTMFYGDVMQALSGCTRGFIKAPNGKLFLCADFSSVEGCVLAFVAEEEEILQNYRDGKDAYCVFASQIHHRPYEVIRTGYKEEDEEFVQMRFEGKTGELACGFQGGEQAVKRFAPDMPRARREEIVKIWRANREKTVAFWKKQEIMAKAAIKYPMKTYADKYIKWKMRGKFLTCTLPGGKRIYYYNPKIQERTIKYKVKGKHYSKTRKVITFWGVDGKTKRWCEQATYGGKLTENIVQATARNFLAEAMLRLEKAGFKIVFHVHDEVIVEAPGNVSKGEFDRFINTMIEVPDWGKGCPISADGFTTRRYHK